MNKKIISLGTFFACSVGLLTSCGGGGDPAGTKYNFSFNGVCCRATVGEEDITSKNLVLDSGSVFTCKIDVNEGFELSTDNIVVTVKNKESKDFTYSDGTFSMKIKGDTRVVASAKRPGAPDEPTKDVTDPETSCTQEEITEKTFKKFYMTVTGKEDLTGDEIYQKMLVGSKEADDLFKVTNELVINSANKIKPIVDWTNNHGETYADRLIFRKLILESGLLDYVLSLGDDTASELISYFVYCFKPLAVMQGNFEYRKNGLDCVPYGADEKSRMLSTFTGQTDILKYINDSDTIYENGCSPDNVPYEPVNFFDGYGRKDFMTIARFIYRFAYCFNFYSNMLRNMVCDGIFFIAVPQAAPTKEQWKNDYDYSAIGNEFGDFLLELDTYLSDNGISTLAKYFLDFEELQYSATYKSSFYLGSAPNLTEIPDLFRKLKDFLNNTSAAQLRSIFRFVAYVGKALTDDYEKIAKDYLFSDDLSKGLGEFLKASIPIYDQAFGYLGTDQTNLSGLINRLNLGVTFDQFIAKMKEFASYEKPEEHQQEIAEYFQNIGQNIQSQFYEECPYNVSVKEEYKYIAKNKTLNTTDFKTSLKIVRKNGWSEVTNFTVNNIIKNLDTSKIGTSNAEVELTVEGKTVKVAPVYKVVDQTTYLGSSDYGTGCSNINLNLTEKTDSNDYIDLDGLTESEGIYDYNTATYFVSSDLSKTIGEVTKISDGGYAYNVEYKNNGTCFIGINKTKLIDTIHTASVTCSAVNLSSVGYHYRSVKIAASDGKTYYTFIRYYVYNPSQKTVTYNIKNSYDVVANSDSAQISANKLTTIVDAEQKKILESNSTVNADFVPTSGPNHITFSDGKAADVTINFHDAKDSKFSISSAAYNEGTLQQRIYKKESPYNLTGIKFQYIYNNDYNCRSYKWNALTDGSITLDPQSLQEFDSTTVGYHSFNLRFRINDAQYYDSTYVSYYVGYNSSDSGYSSAMSSVLYYFNDLDTDSTEVNPCTFFCWRAVFSDKAAAETYMSKTYADFSSKKYTILGTEIYKDQTHNCYLKINGNVLECSSDF